MAGRWVDRRKVLTKHWIPLADILFGDNWIIDISTSDASFFRHVTVGWHILIYLPSTTIFPAAKRSFMPPKHIEREEMSPSAPVIWLISRRNAAALHTTAGVRIWAFVGFVGQPRVDALCSQQTPQRFGFWTFASAAAVLSHANRARDTTHLKSQLTSTRSQRRRYLANRTPWV